MRDWIRLRDMVLSTECDVQPDGDDLQPRADITPESGDPIQTTTKVGHVE